MGMIELKHGDITDIKADAIVNAANNSLLGGGGVDGAIHRKAGIELLQECRTLKGCKTGDAKITKAYKLPAKFIIHTVGPVWKGGKSNEQELLASCYRNCLKLALDFKLESIVFPNISTGVYGFPKELAADIAIKEILEFLNITKNSLKVTVITYDEDNFRIYHQKLGEILKNI